MRWFWIDRFTEFHSGRSATAIKTLSLSEDHLHDHFPGASLMPNSLVLEGMAQTAGLLVCEHGSFKEQVVLAKVSKAIFHFEAWPGDVLTYRALVHDINKDGAMASVTSHVSGKLQAEAGDILCPSGAVRRKRTKDGTVRPLRFILLVAAAEAL